MYTTENYKCLENGNPLVWSGEPWLGFEDPKISMKIVKRTKQISRHISFVSTKVHVSRV